MIQTGTFFCEQHCMTSPYIVAKLICNMLEVAVAIAAQKVKYFCLEGFFAEQFVQYLHDVYI